MRGNRKKKFTVSINTCVTVHFKRSAAVISPDAVIEIPHNGGFYPLSSKCPNGKRVSGYTRSFKNWPKFLIYLKSFLFKSYQSYIVRHNILIFENIKYCCKFLPVSPKYPWIHLKHQENIPCLPGESLFFSVRTPLYLETPLTTLLC